MTYHCSSTVDPRSVLEKRLREAVGAVFGDECAATGLDLHESTSADFESDVAVDLAAARHGDPRRLAERLVAELDAADLAQVEINGSSIRFTIHDTWIGQALREALASPRLAAPKAGDPQMVVIAYPGPDPEHRHAGHLRPMLVGDAVGRCLEFLGHRVVTLSGDPETRDLRAKDALTELNWRLGTEPGVSGIFGTSSALPEVADRFVCVVPAEWERHVEMLCEAARRVGWLCEGVPADHVGIGEVRIAGDELSGSESVEVKDLLDDAVRRAGTLWAWLALGPTEGTAKAVGVGAVELACLAVAPDRGCVLDLNWIVGPRGTNPLPLYAAEIRTRFMEAVRLVNAGAGPVLFGNLEERALALRLLGFGAAVQEAAESVDPRVLTDHLREVAAYYSAFDKACSVFGPTVWATEESRLALRAATLRTLETGLALLTSVHSD
ncbi:arginine--tRNA ligase [Actinomadura sp. KC345]|uniref:arginine--tRNA ligase domain-containing protein n=1 Tax=Actinomadura sp. KC345 TaxID=2530371 RepID=UPI00104A75BC|nr:arginine--tRNA ligase [Actinomadura sp. KC345]TDC49293.1 arginine--tRNA ligase [Actinomadura sp. KC345]